MSEDFPALAGFRAGLMLAGYRLETQVGAGGMAVVFRARDERLGRLVALKILAPALAADEGFRRRFIAESRAAAAVDDPHIIPVYEAGEADGVLFIAMRFVVGGDLRGVLDREGALAPGRVAEVVSAVASALDAAHGAGLVHRDVKPANILVDSRPNRPDYVYLSDFGASKRAVPSVSLTGTGQFLGTPDYSAPEQIQGRGVDGRTDQYALACVTYQLLAGTVPFEQDQGMAVLLAHLSEPPPSLSSRRPDLPEAADEVLARAMAKAPEKRYGSCREFADALREALGLPPYHSRGFASAPDHPRTEITSPSGFSGPTAARTEAGRADPAAAASRSASPSPPRAQPSRIRVWLLATAAIVAAAVTAVAVSLSGGGGSQTTGRPSVSGTITGSLPATLKNPEYPPYRVAFGPDGRTLAVGSVDAQATDGATYLWDTATGKITATLTDPGTQGVLSVAFGPDEMILAAGDANGRTYLWDTATKNITATLTDPGSKGVQSVAFGQDGTILAAGDGNGRTYLWDTATKSITATLTDPGSKALVASVAFGPGETTLTAGDFDGHTYLWDITTGKITATLTDPGSQGVEWVAFGPDGRTLAVGDLSGSAYLWDTATGKITASHSDPGSLGVNSVAFGPDGTTLAVGDHNGHTYLWDTATGKITATLTDPGSKPWVISVAFGPGGTTLATGDGDGSTYLWKIARPTS